jgi:RimJ/RimL family protein N-acetyltransferase
MILERISPNRHLLIDQRMVDWIGKRIPDCKPPNWAQAVGVVHDGKIIAGMALLTQYPDSHDCEIGFAADTPRWATRGTIAKLMAWPLVQLDCRRVTLTIAARNTRAIKFAQGIGFEREGLIRKGRGDDDAVILGLLRDEAPQWMLAASDKKA